MLYILQLGLVAHTRYKKTYIFFFRASSIQYPHSRYSICFFFRASNHRTLIVSYIQITYLYAIAFHLIEYLFRDLFWFIRKHMRVCISICKCHTSVYFFFIWRAFVECQTGSPISAFFS